MNQTNFDPIVNQQSDVLDSPEPIRRTSRITTPPVRYGFATSTHTDSDHPTYTQAMASPDKAAWLVAMQEEFNAFKLHSVGTLVEAPPGANLLGGMLIFTRKRDKIQPSL